MRLLYLTHEAPLEAGRVASGAQRRAAILADALIGAGVEVDHRWSEGWREASIAAAIDESRPDALLIDYWQLAECVPPDRPPLVIDCIAPRPLEEHFVDPVATRAYIERYGRALARGDLILVGNARQRRLLAGWLLAAGADLTDATPLAIVPLGIRPPERPREDHRQPLALVTGGQSWPWRRSRRWLAALGDAAEGSGYAVHCFGGPDADDTGCRQHGLVAAREWTRFLAESAHVGVELADANLEREFAQPYRIADFLEAGLPLLVNRHLPIAELVERFDAGWAVDTPEAARQAAAAAAADSTLWVRKATGARQLALEHFDPARCARPLLEWLERPRRRRQLDIAPAARRPDKRLDRRPSVSGMLMRLVLAPLRRAVDGRGVVVISRSDLFPTDHGAAVKIVETARGLAGLGRPVAIVTGDRDRYWQVDASGVSERRLPLWLRLLALPRLVSHAIHRLRGLPASNAFLYWPLYDPGYGLRAAWVGRRIGASVALAEFPAYAHAARICRLLNGGLAVLVEHNVEYRRLADQVPDLGAKAFDRLKRIELKLANCMDATVCVSDNDRRALIDDGLDPARLTTIPHGVDVARFDAAEASEPGADFGFDDRRPVLVYHGTYSYPPNRQALVTLVEELMPRLQRLGHRVQLLAIGSDPPRTIDHPDVRMPGSLADLGSPLKGCDLAVVPLSAGGGTRMKILDYFAAGLPVVSTSKGCEGLPVRDGEELLIRDGWDAFATAVAELLDDPDARQGLGNRGRGFAEGLGWPQIAERYDRLFDRLR
jgi:glycosyltransferase involved in cell wall biosynthesis